MARDYRRLFDLRFGDAARAESEMDQEIESHIAMRVADLVREGWTEEAARGEAIRRFTAGDGTDFDAARLRLRTAARQRQSSVNHRDRLGALAADVRYAIRQMRRAPGFAALAVGALAIGLGAATTMFTLLDHVILRPLPFAASEQLVALGALDSTHSAVPTVSSADWIDWRQMTRKDIETAIYAFPFRQSLVTADSAARVDAVRVSGNYFEVLGARFVLGRAFTEQEAQNRDQTVVVSERLWRRMFGADSRLAIPLRTATRDYRIAGVVADGQDYPPGTDVWFPAAIGHESGSARNNINWYAIGRLSRGVSLERAGVELNVAAHAVHGADPAGLYNYGISVQPLGQTVAGYASTYLVLLMAGVAFVLLIVCANVAAAGLARGAARSREMAVRTALGASRRRLVEQLLVEHVWQGLVGGALGLLLAWGAVRGILARWGGQIPRANEVTLDARVFLFAFAAAVVAGFAAGVIPALRISRAPLTAALSSGGRTSARGGRHLAGASLVSMEIALSLLLLTGAGLMIRSFRAVLARQLGFDTNVATVEIGLSGPRYATDTARRYAYWKALIDSYRAIPGVDAAGVSNWIPLGLTGQGFVDIGGRELPGAGAIYRTVSDDFFRALDMPLLHGRTFDRTDDAGTPRVAVINAKMAAKYWPGEDPIGKLVRAASMERAANGQPAPWLTIIGVVGDVRTYGLETEPRPEMYALFRQTPSWTTGMTALVRGSLPAGRLGSELRRRARAIDPLVAVDVGTLDDRLRATLGSRTLILSLLSSFATLALLLAALGIYGVLSFAVAQRTRELAVRSALGASRGALLRLVFGDGIRVVTLGVAFGLAGAFWLTRLLRSLLVDVGPTDPASFAGAVVVLVIATSAAILIPAIRATRLDPIVALHAD